MHIVLKVSKINLSKPFFFNINPDLQWEIEDNENIKVHNSTFLLLELFACNYKSMLNLIKYTIYWYKNNSLIEEAINKKQLKITESGSYRIEFILKNEFYNDHSQKKNISKTLNIFFEIRY